jgi:hypothetical protein
LAKQDKNVHKYNANHDIFRSSINLFSAWVYDNTFFQYQKAHVTIGSNGFDFVKIAQPDAQSGLE